LLDEVDFAINHNTNQNSTPVTDWTDLNSFGQAYGYKGTMTGVSFGTATPGTGLDASQAGETGGLAGALQDGSGVLSDDDKTFVIGGEGDALTVSVQVPGAIRESYTGRRIGPVFSEDVTINASYLEGVYDGFVNDGLMGDAKLAADIFEFIFRWQNIETRTEIIVDGVASATEIKRVIESPEFQQFARDLTAVISNLRYGTQLTEEQAELSHQMIGIMGKLAIAIRSKVSDPHEVGRIVGLVLYEVAVAAAISGVSFGAGVGTVVLRSAAFTAKLRKLGIADDVIDAVVDTLKLMDKGPNSAASLMKGRRAGEVLSDEALDSLEMGLLRDRVVLSRNADEFLSNEGAGAMLRVYKDGSATLFLRSNPTRYEILHESQHFEHLRQIGAQRYIELRKTAAGNLELEQFVYDNLRRYHWDGLTPDEIRHAQDYIRWLGGIPW
jgi:hypothetical protein